MENDAISCKWSQDIKTCSGRESPGKKLLTSDFYQKIWEHTSETPYQSPF